jgi:hypothetical protein
MKQFVPTVEALEGRLTPSHVVTDYHYYTVPAHAFSTPPTPKFTYKVAPASLGSIQGIYYLGHWTPASGIAPNTTLPDGSPYYLGNDVPAGTPPSYWERYGDVAIYFWTERHTVLDANDLPGWFVAYLQKPHSWTIPGLPVPQDQPASGGHGATGGGIGGGRWG